MIRFSFASVLVLVSACGSRNEATPVPPPDRSPPIDAEVAATVTPPPADPPPEASTTPHQVRGFRFSVTAPAGWTVQKPDPVLPGNVMMTGTGHDRAYIAMMGLDRAEASDPEACRKASTRLSGVRLESATIVKKTRFGSSCKIVQHDDDKGERIQTEIYTVDERNMLTFACWSSPDGPAPACKDIFASIKPEL